MTPAEAVEWIGVVLLAGLGAAVLTGVLGLLVLAWRDINGKL